MTVAVPGTLTSAYLALKLYAPDVNTVVVPFDEILERVAAGEYEIGLLIHEGQLTYMDAGLHLVADLGEWWAAETGGLPLPLGGNAIRRDLGPELIKRASRLRSSRSSWGSARTSPFRRGARGGPPRRGSTAGTGGFGTAHCHERGGGNCRKNDDRRFARFHF